VRAMVSPCSLTSELAVSLVEAQPRNAD